MEELLMHKTGKWRNDYSPAVKAYQENINQGMDKSLAIEKFVEKLLDLGYSTLPKDQYIARIKRVITNYNLEDLWEHLGFEEVGFRISVINFS